MLIRFANLKTALILLISVIALFFFPAPRGSFVSTHGPVTFIRSCWENALIWLAIILVAITSRRNPVIGVLGRRESWQRLQPDQLSPPGFSILRI